MPDEDTTPMTPEQKRRLQGALLFDLGMVNTTPSLAPRDWQPPSVLDLQQHLPQYEVTAFLARGGMGAVYRGAQRALDRNVAIKILPMGLDHHDPSYAERFKREAKAMASLRHPGIVAVYDAGETDEGLLYYVMEFIDGFDVAHLIKSQGRLAPEHALDILVRVCDALEYAHQHGVVHRDIKPSNIMIERDGTVKIADFGLAKLIQDQDHGGLTSSMAMGTPDYVSPEALIPGIRLDGRADLYAMGVMLYQMLTGQIPRGRFELPSGVVPQLDPRLDAIVDRAMQTDREKRYSSAAEIKAAVVKITSPRPDTVRSVGAFPSSNDKRSGSASAPSLGDAIGIAATDDSPLNNATKDTPFVNSVGLPFVPAGTPEVLFSVYDTRVKDFATFVDDAQYDAEASTGNGDPAFSKDRSSLGDGVAWTQTGGSWRDPHFPPGHEQQEDHPVVCVSFADAQAFCAWLTNKEHALGKLPMSWSYRLPTDAEWSQACGGNEYPWGNYWPPTGTDGNYCGKEAILGGYGGFKNDLIAAGYQDGYARTAPVGGFKANGHGLYDMGGNVWQWCSTWYRTTMNTPDALSAIPVLMIDGGGETLRVARGAAWDGELRIMLRSAFRAGVVPRFRIANLGFRCVVSRNDRSQLS